LKNLVHLFVVLVFALLLLMTIAADAAAPSSTAIAGAAMLLWGLLSPFILKHVPAEGDWMKVISFGVTFLVAAAALLLSGEAHVDVGSAASILAFTFTAYGMQQALWNALKDSSRSALVS